MIKRGSVVVSVVLVMWFALFLLKRVSNGQTIIDNPKALKAESDRLAARLVTIQGSGADSAGLTLGAGDFERLITVQKRQRRYELHVPAGYDKSKPAPLVLVFHGGGGRAGLARIQTQLDAKSDAAGFIVAYLDGSGLFRKRLLTWNAGNCCGYAMQKKIDDVAFVRAMLDDVARFFAIDPARVFATGHSNGAMMCHRLACDLSDRIAAIAAVGAPLGLKQCAPQRPIPVMHIHGTADQNAPFNGGVGAHSASKTRHASAEDCVMGWVRRNKCSNIPVSKRTEGEAVITTYKSGGGVEVVFVAVKGMGHTWPGGKRLAKESFSGAMSRNVSANDLMWEFFKRHPMRASG